MSLWTTIRNIAESPITATTGIIGGILGNDDLKNQNKMVNDQIKAYKEQTALTRQQLDQTRAAQEVEKRRIQEKQIRSLRSNYRPAGGLLGVGNPATNDMTNQLGA